MFDALTRGFRAARDRLQGVAELTEDGVGEALREVRTALLEADVEFRVAGSFLDRVKERAVGTQVRLRARATGRRAKLGPGEHFVRICQQELAALMGPVDASLAWAKKGPTGFMVVGLQGSGKTTTVAKLARHLRKAHHRRPLLVAADVYRPAAIEQLKVLGAQIEVPVFAPEGATDPVRICVDAMRHAHEKGRDAVLMDTAGRLTVDAALMEELSRITAEVKPANIFLVCDAMIGQDAVKTARAFDERLDLSGVILTKLDGDARGGAALSIKEVTGKPIKFVGMGEGLDRLEEFRPDGMASRILGMGDIVGLIKDFEEVAEEEQSEQDALRMLRGRFDMGDFLEQIRLLKKMTAGGGGMMEMLDKMGMAQALPDNFRVDDRELVKIESLIRSMTAAERRNPDLFKADGVAAHARRRREEWDLSRVRRVANGSGRREAEVKELLGKFAMMKQMMMAMGAQAGLLGHVPGFRQLSQMKQLGGLDMQKLMEVSGLRAGAIDRRVFRPPPVQVDRAREKRKRKEARKARKRNRKKW